MSRVSKSKRPVKPKRPAPSRGSDRVHHMHVVVDDTLHNTLEAHARKLEGIAKDDDRQPNISAAARDAMRRGLGLPTVSAG